MSTVFRNKVIKEIGTEDQTVLSTDESTNTTVIGLSLANLTNNPVFVSIKIVDDSSTEGFYIKDVVIPAESSLRALSGGEKLVLAPNNQMIIVSNQENSLDAVISYVDIAA